MFRARARVDWRARLVDSVLWQACTLHNPFLVHEFNALRTDQSFWRMLILFCIGYWFFFFQAPELLVLGNWILEEGFVILALAVTALLLVHRLRRPHIRYNGENAVFLCLVPREGKQLIVDQMVAVLFQPLLLLFAVAPLAVLVVAVGMVDAPTLVQKMGFIALILVSMAAYGVARVPRLWYVLLAFPVGTFLIVMGGFLVTNFLSAFVNMLAALASGVPPYQMQPIPGLGELVAIIYTLVLLPYQLFITLVNPIWTYLLASPNYRASLGIDTGPYFQQPLTTFMQSYAAISSAGSSPIRHALWFTTGLHWVEQVLVFFVAGAGNLVAMLALNGLYLRDAWIRGSDQFEYFRVRGYPANFREFRLLERRRAASRNLRTLAEKAWRIGEWVEVRVPWPRLRPAVKQCLVYLAFPWRYGHARHAVTRHPEDFYRWMAQTQRDRAPALRRRLSPGLHRASAPPQVTTTMPPPMAVPAPPVLDQQGSLVVPPASPPPPPPPAFTPVALPSPAPAEKRRARTPSGAGKLLIALFRWPMRITNGLLSLLLAAIPRELRNNAVFRRDLSLVRAIMGGQREGVWSYSWTVLLTITVLIATFIYLMASIILSLSSLAELRNALLRRGGVTVGLEESATAIYVYLAALYYTVPFVFFALPVYAYLKERQRTDWHLFALTSQSGSSVLIGRFSLFMLMGTVGFLVIPLLALLLNPLALGGFLLDGLFPFIVDNPPWWQVSPLLVIVVMLALTGLCALYYQLAQVATFLVACLNWRQSRARLGRWAIAALVGFFLLTLALVLFETELDRVVPWERVWRALPLKEIESFAFAVSEVAYNLGTLALTWIATITPLTPAGLLGLLLDNPGYGTYGMDFPVELTVSLDAALLTIVSYWGLALVGHWIASALWEARLRGEEPRHFSLSWRRRRRVAP